MPILKQPSAFLPIALSLAALITVLTHLTRHGPAPQSDEGTAAHIWQLLMTVQLPMVGYFAFRWVPRAPREALFVLAIQAGAAVAAMVPVFLLHW